MNLKGIIGLFLLSAFVLMRLFTTLPLVFFAFLPFSLFVGLALTVWFLYEVVLSFSEFSQMVIIPIVFIPLWIFVLVLVVVGTPMAFRSGIGPFAVSLRFAGWIGFAFVGFLLTCGPLLFQRKKGW